MAKKHETSYWPHMILGFLLIGVTLGYWTVKSASHLPVSEENRFMTTYQDADTHINDFLAAQERFKARYRIRLDAEKTKVPVEHSKAKKFENSVILHKGENRFVYRIETLEGKAVSDMNVSFLLTRPHTNADDQKAKTIRVENGNYIVEGIEIEKPGRYILEFRANKGDATDFMRTPAYLKP